MNPCRFTGASGVHARDDSQGSVFAQLLDGSAVSFLCLKFTPEKVPGPDNDGAGEESRLDERIGGGKVRNDNAGDQDAPEKDPDAFFSKAMNCVGRKTGSAKLDPWIKLRQFLADLHDAIGQQGEGIDQEKSKGPRRQAIKPAWKHKGDF